MLKYVLVNLGCPKNEVDGQYLETILLENGFIPAEEEQKSDLIIINTCGFIESAQEESINTIIAAARLKENRDIKLIVVGCLSQRFGEELGKELPEVDVFMGVGIEEEFKGLIKKIKENDFQKRLISDSLPFSRGDYSLTHRNVSGPVAYLKIAEGCNNLCSYCAIPSIRGSFQSRRLEDLEKEARYLVGRGVMELIIVAQDITRYGKDLYGESRLVELLNRLASIEGLQWIRLMYLQPGGISEELVNFISQEKKIVPYLEIPIQHIRPKILKGMNRDGDEKKLETLFQMIREKIPGVALRTTLMVGFPGETEEDFQALKNFMGKMKFERLGIFKYSPEKGTPAVNFTGKVHETVKEKRLRELEDLQKKIANEHNQEMVGGIFEVLIEEVSEDYAYGRTKWDAPEIDNLVIIEGGKDLEVGKIYPVRINLALDYELVGEVCYEFTQ